jgi:diadenosine tetraphosphate (Ap4A) HIT family hydrolase
MSVTLFDGDDMEVVVPSYALASGSLQVVPKGDVFNSQEAYLLLQRVAHVWHEKGIDNYLVYKKSDERCWEIVPYYRGSFALWNRICSYARQIVVLTRVTFGRAAVTSTEYQALPSQAKTNLAAEDAFCKKEVIDRQLVLEGKYINVLYNYAPINAGKDQLHFLLVSKVHRDGFTDLTKEEVAEAAELTDRITAIFGGISYQYHKTGSLAGQTVPHWHQHLVFVDPAYNLWSILTVLFGMVIPASPLSAKELESRVIVLREQMKKAETVSQP